MNPNGQADPELARMRRIDRICDSFRAAWDDGRRLDIERLVAESPVDDREPLRRELQLLENSLSGAGRTSPAAADLSLRTFAPPAHGEQAASSANSPPVGDCSVTVPLPERIGRYRVVRLLGSGGFGRVYLAVDEQLERQVAIKVPHPHLVRDPEHVRRVLAEARAAAALDHPQLVPVYDVGESAEAHVHIVCKYVAGRTLAEHLAGARLSPAESAELVASVAEALHHAHLRGLVHRDIKPGNILLDDRGRPHLLDFGLALRMTEDGVESRLAGTPAYMSPEQARGDGHLVDGRADIYSLGVVLYELLTGHRPFQSASLSELLEQILVREPRPPRQLDDTISPELERCCLRALSKRIAERPTTARDFAVELRKAVRAGGHVAPYQRIMSGRFVLAVIACVLLIAGPLVWTRLFGPLPSRAAPEQPDLRSAAFLANEVWTGQFRFLPPYADYEGPVEVRVLLRDGERFEGRYVTEDQYEWSIAGTVRGKVVQWGFVALLRGVPGSDLVGQAEVVGSLGDGEFRGEFHFQAPSRDDRAELTLRSRRE